MTLSCGVSDSVRQWYRVQCVYDFSRSKLWYDLCIVIKTSRGTGEQLPEQIYQLSGHLRRG